MLSADQGKQQLQAGTAAPSDAPEPKKSRPANGSLGLILGTASVLFFIATWQTVASLNLADPQMISSPQRVFVSFIDLAASGELMKNVWVSLEEFFLGMAISLAIGIPVGLLLGWYEDLRLFFDPLIMVFYSLPRDALMPVLVILFGIGLASKVAIVYIGAFFPIVVNTIAGISEVNPYWVKAAKSFGANDRDIFRKILFPGSLPYMMSGIVQGVSRGVHGVVIAEMYVSLLGLGSLIMKAQVGLNTDRLMAVILFTAFFGYVIIRLVRSLESKVARWKEA